MDRRDRVRFRGSVLLVAACLLASQPAGAPAARKAQAEPQRRQEFQLTVRSDLVNVEVAVTDARGKFVAGLRRENFRVFDDGVEQPITHFAAMEAPARILLLVETSPAVYLLHREHLEAAQELLAALKPEDEVALGVYDQSARLLLPFSRDKLALAQALAGLRYNLGTTQLYLLDSVAAALGWLDSVPGRRAMVLLTTGLDTSSPERRAAVERKLSASDTVVFAVALGGALRGFRGRAETGGETEVVSFEQADRTLRALAERTGGQAYFPHKPAQFPALYREVGARLRHHYSLGFQPRVLDGRYHPLAVQVFDERGRLLVPGGKYRAYFRRGYLAPAPD